MHHQVDSQLCEVRGPCVGACYIIYLVARRPFNSRLMSKESIYADARVVGPLPRIPEIGADAFGSPICPSRP
ncbi:hypothetical protein THAOC_21648 [Thalassiosira oceanica]|uniref:Uncharacterized protein n=1 Tax=Thalassiosira oceanica TaxID=159749 RepID=K0SIC7_THAOC|nr:hypothetical protein THAOC_21648 [Thalassiosira oceanica]|eukprot:EJK58242.1 hypothetical protein THAOC_21648 [Thalassiosira oceanica]